MAKTGRKRKTGKREPNGRLSREGYADKIKSVAVEARERVHGMTKEEAKLPMPTDPVGMLARFGEIDKYQYQAALQYEQDTMDYRAAMGIPSEARAMDLNKVQGRPLTDEEAQAMRAQNAIKRYKAANARIQAAQDELRGRGNLFGAIDTLVMRHTYSKHLVGDLRIALNALVRHYGLNRRAA